MATTYRKRGLGQLPCFAVNCPSRGTRRGLCPKHYARLRRNGDLDLRMGESGKGYDHQGYRRLTVNGRRVLEHRLVIEQALGRSLLDTEDVHHINGNKLDNQIENLIVLSHADHSKLHWAEGKRHPNQRAD